jgi:hypothetical protein
MKPTYTAKLVADAGRYIPDAKLVTLNSMATGSVGTIEYDGQLYEVRIVPAEYGIEKWAHPSDQCWDCQKSASEHGHLGMPDEPICPSFRPMPNYLSRAK